MGRGGAAPYSFRHGAVLPPGQLGGPPAPPPPPLDAEELFELLDVPMVVVQRAPNYKPPIPPLRGSTPPPPAAPAPQQPAEGEAGAQEPPQPPQLVFLHGEPSDMEVVFCLGVYDTDWDAAGAVAAARIRDAREAQRGRGWSGDDHGKDRDRDLSPMSPLRPIETYSPAREEQVGEEQAAEQQWQQRQAQLRQQQAHQFMMMGYNSYGSMPGTSGPLMPGASGGPEAKAGAAAGAGASTGSMPLIMDLRSAGAGATPGPGAGGSSGPGRPLPGSATPAPGPMPLIQDLHTPMHMKTPGTVPRQTSWHQDMGQAGGLSSAAITPAGMPRVASISQWEGPAGAGVGAPPAQSAAEADGGCMLGLCWGVLVCVAAWQERVRRS